MDDYCVWKKAAGKICSLLIFFFVLLLLRAQRIPMFFEGENREKEREREDLLKDKKKELSLQKTLRILVKLAGRHLPFGHLPFETLAMQTVAIWDSCHSVQLPFETLAIRLTCHSGQLPFGTVALRTLAILFII